jgi:hypothetical protein
LPLGSEHVGFDIVAHHHGVGAKVRQRGSEERRGGLAHHLRLEPTACSRPARNAPVSVQPVPGRDPSPQCPFAYPDGALPACPSPARTAGRLGYMAQVLDNDDGIKIGTLAS